MRPGGPSVLSNQWNGNSAAMPGAGPIGQKQGKPKDHSGGNGPRLPACCCTGSLQSFQSIGRQRAIPLSFRHSYFRQSSSRTG